MEYYVHVEDNSGREGTRPICAPGAVYSFNTGVSSTTTGSETPAMALSLEQNYPNPLNPSTTITFYLPSEGHVTLRVFDASGREVARLLDAVTSAGEHVVDWDGKDSGGNTLNSGVYFYELRTAAEIESKKMILLR